MKIFFKNRTFRKIQHKPIPTGNTNQVSLHLSVNHSLHEYSNTWKFARRFYHSSLIQFSDFEQKEKAAREGNAAAAYEVGMHSFESGEFEKAKEMFLICLAEEEHPDVYFMLGCIYAQGVEGGNPVEYFEKSAKLGSDLAMCVMGEMAEDEKVQREYFEKAAKMGNPVAKFHLGTLSEGEEKVKYLKEAVADGYTPAVMELGKLYEEGIGVERDMNRAIELYKAAAQDVPQASYKLGEIFEMGHHVDINYKIAREYFEQAAVTMPAASFKLAEIFVLQGKPEKAIQHYRHALKGGPNPFAQYRLGAILLDPQKKQLTEEEKDEGVRLIRSAAETYKLPDAQFFLAILIRNGLVTDLTAKDMVELIERTAKLGYGPSMVVLGDWYSDGIYGFPEDLPKAVEWYKKAADKEDGTAQFNVAVAYLEGKGVEKDVPKGIEYLRMAADNGSPDAKQVLRDYGHVCSPK